MKRHTLPLCELPDGRVVIGAWRDTDSNDSSFVWKELDPSEPVEKFLLETDGASGIMIEIDGEIAELEVIRYTPELFARFQEDFAQQDMKKGLL